MEKALKEALNTTVLKPSGYRASGCISQGEAYRTDQGLVFIKKNTDSKSKVMFEGEFASLEAIKATNTVRVPEPLAVVDGSAIAMEYFTIKGLQKYSRQLGEKLARLHLHNESLRKKEEADSSRIHKNEKDPQYVSKFGFATTTCCGSTELDNTWCDDWPAFYARNRLDKLISSIVQDYNDRELMKLWSELQIKMPDFFKTLTITPALVHGDLWSGNAGEIESEPVIYDPASFYGHSEFEFGIMRMFGGFGREVDSGYYSLMPQVPGYQKRIELYKLFHTLNHWNIFGTGYRGSSISIMKSLLKK